MTQIGTAKIETASGTEVVPVWDPSSIDDPSWLRIPTPNGTGAVRLVDVGDAEIDSLRVQTPDGLKAVSTSDGVLPSSEVLDDWADSPTTNGSIGDRDSFSSLPYQGPNSSDRFAETGSRPSWDVVQGSVSVDDSSDEVVFDDEQSVIQTATDSLDPAGGVDVRTWRYRVSLGNQGRTTVALLHQNDGLDGGSFVQPNNGYHVDTRTRDDLPQFVRLVRADSGSGAILIEGTLNNTDETTIEVTRDASGVWELTEGGQTVGTATDTTYSDADIESTFIATGANSAGSGIAWIENY